MAITTAQTIYVRRKVGDKPDDTIVAAIYARHDADGLASPEEWTILEILETRYANMVGSPSSFTIPGDYGQTIGAENLRALAEMIDQQRAYMVGLGLDVPGAGGIGAMTVVLPADHTYNPRLR